MCYPHDTGVLYSSVVPIDGCRIKVPRHFLAILSVCRLFHNEAPPVLFGGNTFVAGRYRECTNLFLATLAEQSEYIKLIRTMQFRYLHNHNFANGPELIQRTPNLTKIDLGGFITLPAYEAAAWKRVVTPGHIVQQNSTIYKMFPKLHKAQMYRFDSRGTLITATMKVTSENGDVRMRSTSKYARSLTRFTERAESHLSIQDRPSFEKASEGRKAHPHVRPRLPRFRGSHKPNLISER
jgi:hypothetical protein